LLTKEKDITSFEIETRLTKLGPPAGIGSVHRFLARDGIITGERSG
jgi:hypothetical protein